MIFSGIFIFLKLFGILNSSWWWLALFMVIDNKSLITIKNINKG